MPEPYEPVQRLLFTAPWDPVTVRRGDALGLRAIADRFADILAPDLSNRIRDARWITIIAWCLARSHEVWARAGRNELTSRLGSEERYAWLRPLELMWIARTILLAPDEGRGRQLAGQQRVRRWIKDGCRAPRFAMSTDQFRRYRQAGMYGGYRVVFRRIPRLTQGADGWTSTQGTHGLANWLHSKLGKKAIPIDWEEKGFKWAVWRGNEERWWLEIWSSFRESSSSTFLPCRFDDHARLPEAKLLAPLLFGADAGGRRRMRVAELMNDSDAADHLDLCASLARELAKEPDAQILRALPAFSRLADAGMDLMDKIGRQLMLGGKGPGVSITDLASNPSIRRVSEELRAAARAWLTSKHSYLPRGEVVDALAQAVSSPNASERLSGLLRHHEEFGGGLKWFVLREGAAVPRLLFGGTDSSRYRFRLWSLGRIAAQCGLTSGMPTALMDDRGSQLEDPITEDSTDEER